MFIDINKIEGEGLAFDQALPLSPLEADGGGEIPVAGLRISGTAEKGERGIDLTAHLVCRVQLACSRCLEPVEREIDVDFFLTLVAEMPRPESEEVHLHEADTALFVAEDGKAELRAIAAEQIYLNLPLKSVCRPDCAGLCPSCGANRNLLECDCREETIDPRLAPLRQLKTRMEKGEG